MGHARLRVCLERPGPGRLHDARPRRGAHLCGARPRAAAGPAVRAPAHLPRELAHRPSGRGHLGAHRFGHAPGHPEQRPLCVHAHRSFAAFDRGAVRGPLFGYRGAVLARRHLPQGGSGGTRAAPGVARPELRGGLRLFVGNHPRLRLLDGHHLGHAPGPGQHRAHRDGFVRPPDLGYVRGRRPGASEGFRIACSPQAPWQPWRRSP